MSTSTTRAPSRVRHLAGAALLLAAACDSGPPRPSAIEGTAPLDQTVTVGTAVAQPPAVRVTSDRGRAVPGVTVTFTVAAGGGGLIGGVAQTDAQGVARATQWTVGTAVGENRVVARANGVSATVVFRATAGAGAPAAIELITGPPTLTLSGAPLVPQPAVRIVDDYANPIRIAGRTVTASVSDAALTVSGATTTTDSLGVAAFTALTLTGPVGSYTLQFSTAGLATTAAPSATVLVDDLCTTTQPLDYALGEIRRFTLDGVGGSACLDYDLARHQNHRFLLLLENLPHTGAYDGAVFPGVQASSVFSYSITGLPRATAGVIADAAAATRSVTVLPAPPADAVHGWDFGDGPIYEIAPVEPAGGVVAPRLLTASGLTVDMNSAAADPQVGDTLIVRMEGIQRLGIATGNQRAVIRRVSEHLVIAEDVRLGTLTRENGRTNTPLTAAVMDSIVTEYEAVARVQGDLFFENRHNNAVEAAPPPRTIAVHSLMYANNIWGYTYSSGNYFVWDFWVGTDGSTKGLNQSAQRNTDNLFMHEIAHMRHWGLLQRNGQPPRGNRWLVEGFARFSERLPIAARLLGTTNPSRTANLVLPRNPLFGNSYFRDDVPTFMSAGSSMFDGYQASSFVFDYFADHVEAAGGDWRVALREFLIAAGNPVTLDAAVGRWLPGLGFGELFTRARVALYLDDIGTPGLPAWTQYLQFQLRDSRPAGTAAASDPRAAWPTLRPGTTFDVNHLVAQGAAVGFVIDGTQAAGSGFILFQGPAAPNAVVSITRIR